jgi:RHS repeat-associated protein
VTKGSGYNTNLSYNGLTNQINTPGYGYDANGNLTAMPALGMGYDGLNRMISSTPTSGATKVYAYGPGGQRVGQSAPPDQSQWGWPNNMWTIYVFGPDGRRIADRQAFYQPANPQYPQQNLHIQAQCGTAYVYFRGKLVRKENVPLLQNGVWVAQVGVTIGTDRLGSVTYRGYTGAASYYPYGEEETPTANDTQKYATYTRDSATGLDYAQHRYYASQIGRFTTADPSKAGTDPKEPQSWNRYPYVGNDPTNHRDPSGLLPVVPVGGGGDDGSDAGQANGPAMGCTFGWPCVGDDPGLDDGEFVCSANQNTGSFWDGEPDPTPCAVQRKKKEKQPEPPDCSLDLEYRGVAWPSDPVDHAVLVVTDGFGYVFSMEALPTYTWPPWGMMYAQNWPGDIGNTIWGQLTSDEDPNLCSQINRIETAEAYYSAHEVQYLGWGPNSNSFISWLLDSGWVNQYFTAPPNTPGWNTPLYPTPVYAGQP